MSDVLPLLDWTPPKPLGHTFKADRDGPRLAEQAVKVQRFMADGAWHTLKEIAAATGAPEASSSARLRDLRRAGFTVERRHVQNGLHEYRVAA